MELSSRRKKLLAGLLLGAAVLGLYSFLTPVTEYEKFEVESLNSSVERVTAECTCYGGHITATSYPPQYMCRGLEFCSDVNYTRPRR